MDLEKILDKTPKNNPGRYEPDVVDRVRNLVRREIENPEKSKPYRLLTDIDDFILYHSIHPEWKGKSTEEMRDDKESGANAFYQAFKSQVNKQTEDKKERKKLIQKIFPQKYKDYSGLTSIDDWIKEYQQHPEWQGKSTKEMGNDTESGANAFYKAFRKWVNKQTEDKKERKERTQKIFPQKYKDYSGLTSIDNWIKEYQQHPEWKGKSTKEMRDDKESGAKLFYYAFKNWVDKQTEDKKRRKELTKKVLQLKNRDHIGLASIDDWIKEYQQHPEWQGKSTTEMGNDTESGANSFYKAFHEWVNKQTEDKKQRKELTRQVFTELKAPFFYKFNDCDIQFDSRPERIVALVIYQYGLVTKYTEEINLHVRVNGKKRHSIDFLVGETFIEYHPLSPADRKKGIKTVQGAGKRKRQSITNPAYQGFDFHHIWEVGQLYDVLRDEKVSAMLPEEHRPLSLESFEQRVAEVYKLAAAYDLARQEERANKAA